MTRPAARVVPAATPVRALTLTGPPVVELRLRVDCPACRRPLIAPAGPGTVAAVAAVLADHAPHCPAAGPARFGGLAVDVVLPADRFRGGVVL